LQASYIIFLLEPYFENAGKRLIKAPKLYFYDVGFAAYLLGIEDKSHMERHPLRGNLFENLVVMELVKHRYNQGLDHNLHFYRDSNGNEIDIVYKSGASLIPVEIKAAQTFIPDFLKGLRHLHKAFPKTAEAGYLVYTGNREYTLDGFRVIHYNKAHHILTS
jgi:predicted AAA+ superfamily ATPase